MQWNGYDSSVVTRQLMDELRELNEDAQSEATGLTVDPSYVDQSLGQYADYLGIGKLVDTTRNLVGANEWYISSEIADSNGKIVYTARLFTPKSDEPVDTVRVEGDPANPAPMIHQAAVELLTRISPYIVALHFFKQETAEYRKQEAAATEKPGAAAKTQQETAASLKPETTEQRWAYPMTRDLLVKHIENPPPDDNYLAYDLIGRMHRLRAEEDTTLTPEQRHQERLDAIENLNSALRQNPSFLYTNFTLGVVYDELEDYANADKYFAHAVRIDPNFLPAREHWARILVKRDRLREAVFQYVAAVEIDPADAELRDKLADLYFKLNHADAALAQWQAAELIDPTNGQTRERLKALGKQSP
jgi:tetratricopeptide (TPR) repeat protein